MTNQWKDGLCDCMNDVITCLVAGSVPNSTCFIQAATVAKATKGSSWTPYFCIYSFCCIGAAINRGMIRQSLSIDGNFCCDCIIWLFCPMCALCQEYRTVQALA